MVSGDFFEGKSDLEVILQDTLTYNLTATSASLSPDSNFVPLLLNGVLNCTPAMQAVEIHSNTTQPFEVIVEDEAGNPFSGIPVEISGPDGVLDIIALNNRTDLDGKVEDQVEAKVDLTL